MSSFLNKFLHEFLGPTLDTILIILFCNINTRYTFLYFERRLTNFWTCVFTEHNEKQKIKSLSVAYSSK